MSDELDSGSASLPLQALERIETVCLEFEAVWKKGERPRIEDYLGATLGAERSGLFRELLLLDLDYRSRSEQHPSEDEYRARFPQDSHLVSDVFEELSTGAAVTETSPYPSAPVSRRQTLPCQFGDYELLEVLGEGGMGIVYRARQQTPDRIVALKIIHPDRLAAGGSERREKAIERFRAETQAAASLEHEHIVPVYEVGQIEGQPFFSMRYIQARGLEEVLRDGPLDGRDAAALLEPIAQALHYAHGRDIVHRDIKPRNILLDTGGKPHVADFGLAKSFAGAQDLTQTAEAIGTPAYMSPEQAEGPADVDSRTDVYSLGATLYELLTGRPPFRAATAVQTQRQVVENEPVPPRQLNPAIDRDLETICLRCLEKEPAKRYATAQELAEELTRYQQGRPIQARPITRFARGWRWCRRNRALAFAGATAATLLLVFAVGGPVIAARFAALLEIAETNEQRAEDEAAKRLEESINAREAEKEADRAKTEAERREAAERRAKQETRHTLYVGDMRLVQEYWGLGHIEVCRRLLERYRPKPGEELDEDLRSFEWHYWWRQCHQDLMTLRHRRAVQRVAISPDGTLLAAAEAGGWITLWDLSTGQPAKRLHVDGPNFSALSFSDDSETLAAAWGPYSRVTMWNVPSGDVVCQDTRFVWWQGGRLVHEDTPEPNFKTKSGSCATFNTKCTRIGKSWTCRAYVWERSGNTSEFTLTRGDLAGMCYVVLEGGKQVGTIPMNVGSAEQHSGGYRSWSLADENAPPLRLRGGPVFCMTFSPDATRLAVGGCQGTVKVWELAEVKEPVIVQGHEGIVWSVAFSPGGETIASAGADGQVVLWDVQTGTQKTTIPAHTGDVQGVVFVHDGKTLVSAGLDSTIKFWDANTGELITTRKGHEGPVTCLAPFADGRRVASASSDGTVKVWSIPTRDEQVFAEIPSAIFLGAAFSPDGEQLAAVVRNDPHDIAMRPPRTPASVSEDKLILSDWKQGIRLKHRNLNRLGLDTAVCPAFSPDGRLLAAREELMNVTWMLTDKFPPDIPYEFLRLNEDLPRPQQSLCPVGPGAFFPDGKTLATPDLVHGRVELWNVPEGSRRDKFPTQAMFCLCVAVSPEGSMLAVAADQNVQLWSADGRKLKDLGAHSDFADELLGLLDVPRDLARDLGGHTDFVRCVVFSHDGNTLVSASSDGTVKLWDVDTGAERATLRGHKGGVSWVAISPDDRTVASAGRDGTIKLWDLESGEEKTTLKGHAGWVTSVAFSPDGLTLASTSEDGTLRLWKGATDH